MGVTEQVVLGGMALPDGVLVRSQHAWAVARADGTVETGPVKRSPVAKIPVVRIGYAIVMSLMDGLRRKRKTPTGRGRLRRMLLAMVAAMAVAWVFEQAFPDAPTWASGWLIAIVTLAAVRLFMPPSLWRYHGAEHKAIATFEHALPLTVEAAKPVSRIHDRCGTNAVFLGLLVAPFAAQSWSLLLATLVAAEVVRFAVMKHQRSPVTRVLVAGGRLLQRTVTTTEPTDDELVVGLRAVDACLAKSAETARPA